LLTAVGESAEDFYARAHAAAESEGRY